MSTDDIIAIRGLADRYSDAANRANPADMAAVYVEDAQLVALDQPAVVGRAAIEKVFAYTIGLMEFMNQICSGAVIDVDGDCATARWTVTEFSKRRNGEKLEIFLGTYQDDLVRTPEGWRFARRVLSRRAQARFEGVLRI